MVWEGDVVWLHTRQGKHWVLGVINLLEESFEVYDSGGGRDPLSLYVVRGYLVRGYNIKRVCQSVWLFIFWIQY